VRESDRKLTGYVTLTLKDEGITLTQGCSATMGDDGAYLWRCQ
jgi:hypothetical protein